MYKFHLLLTNVLTASHFQLFHLLNFLMENFVFTYIGVATFTFPKHSWDAGLIMFALVSFACCVYEFLTAFALEFLQRLRLLLFCGSIKSSNPGYPQEFL